MTKHQLYGKAIPCIQHIYADSPELDETLYAAEWLYQNTMDKETESICISLIKSYGCTLDRQNVIRGILKDINKKPYVFLCVWQTIGCNNKIFFRRQTDDLPPFMYYFLHIEFCIIKS